MEQEQLSSNDSSLSLTSIDTPVEEMRIYHFPDTLPNQDTSPIPATSPTSYLGNTNMFTCNKEFRNKTKEKDLTTALSGLSQAEIAKIKSVLDRDQDWLQLYWLQKPLFNPQLV